MKVNIRKNIVRAGIAGFLFLSVIGSTVFTVHPVSASPTDAYWVGGSGDWSDATNHWATTSGGSPAVGNLPASTTNVHFDANSGFTIGSYTVTLDTSGSCLSEDWSGVTHTPRLVSSGTSSMCIYGSLTLRYDF